MLARSFTLVAAIFACACHGAVTDSPANDSGTATGSDGGSDGGGSIIADGGDDADAAVEEVRFSFVIIPDTQNEVLDDSDADQYFNDRIEWIVDNKDALNVRFVMQTGDLCNWDTPDHDQYERASIGLAGLDVAGIPYGIAIGNHDTAATCPGGSACEVDGKTTNDLLRDTTTFNAYFPEDRFPTMAGQFEPPKVDNAYHLIRAGGLDWILINLELWARPAAYAWVDEILAEFPDHNAVVFTHDHLTGAGTIQTSNGGYGDTSPKQIFDEVLSQHANMRLVFSGHEGVSAFREDTGVHGNRIFQFLYNRTDGKNPTRVVTIDTAENTIDAYVYSPSDDSMVDGPGTTVNLTSVEWVE